MAVKSFLQQHIHLVIASTLLLAFFVLQNINGRFWLNDFEVYYSACQSFVSGDQVYGKSFGLSSGFYKYSPAALLFFIPLAILPNTVAKVLFYFVVSAAILNIVWLSNQVIQQLLPTYSSAKNSLTSILLLLICGNHLYRELHLGNVNAILLLVLLWSLLALLKQRDILSGLLFGTVLLFKPHFLILLPLFVLRKKHKTLIVGVFTVVLGLFIPSIIIGWQANLSLLQQWLVSMRSHNTSIATSPDTIYYWLSHLINSDYYPFLVLATITFIALLVFLLVMKNKAEKDERSGITVEYLLLTALVPSLTLTDTEHFLLSLPLIAFLISFLLNNYWKNWYLPIIIGLLLYGGNWTDLLGRELSAWYATHGLLGLGNIIILISFVILCLKPTKLNTMKD